MTLSHLHCRGPTRHVRKGANTKFFRNRWNRERFTGSSSTRRGGVGDEIFVWRERQVTGSSTASRLRREIGKRDTKQLMVGTNLRRQIDVKINEAFLHGWDKNHRNSNVANPPGVTTSIRSHGEPSMKVLTEAIRWEDNKERTNVPFPDSRRGATGPMLSHTTDPTVALASMQLREVVLDKCK